MELLEVKFGSRLSIPKNVLDELDLIKGDRFQVLGEQGKIILIPKGVNERKQQNKLKKNTLMRIPKSALLDSGIRAGDLLKVDRNGEKIELVAIDRKVYKKTKEIKELDIHERNEKLERRNSIVKGIAITVGSVGAIVLIRLIADSNDDRNNCAYESEGKYVVKMYDSESGEEIETMDEVFDTYEEAEEYCDVCYADFSTGAEVLELAGEDFCDPWSVDFFAEQAE